MSFPIEFKLKPGPDNRPPKEMADDLLMKTSLLLEKIEERAEEGVEEQEVPFPNIPLDCNNTPKRRLTFEEEYALSHRYHRYGDIKARDVLMLSQLKMVYFIVNQNRSRLKGKKDDAIQEGRLGLFRAAEKFDPTRKIRFNTYSTWWIKASIKRFATKESETWKANVQGCLSVKEKIIPLDADSSFGEEMRYMIEDSTYPNPEDAVISAEAKRLAQRLAAKVQGEIKDPRVGVLFRERLFSDSPKTLVEIGKDYSVSRERIRQIEGRVLSQFEEKAKKRFASRVA